MTETFTLKETTSFKEYVVLVYYQTFRMRIVKAIFGFLMIICVLSTLLEFYLAENEKWYNIILLNLLLPPVFLITFLFVVGFLVTVLLKIFKPAVFNVTNKFTHWGLERTGEGLEFSIPWGKFFKSKETKKFIVLYITRDHSLVIQKKLFNSDDQLEDFRQLISEKIQAS